MMILINFILLVAVSVDAIGFVVPLSRHLKANSENLPQDPAALRLISSKNYVYSAEVLVGSREQKFRVVMDTASYSFWLPLTGCVNEGENGQFCDKNHGLYEPDASTSASYIERIFNVAYLPGSPQGDIFADNFAFVSGAKPVPLPEQIEFGGAKKTHDGDMGYLGLSFPVQNQFGSSIIEEYYEQKVLSRSTFTIFYKKCQNSLECRDAGQITFGMRDTKNCGEIVGLAKKEPDNYLWKIDVDATSVGEWSRKKSFPARLDSGKSFIELPTKLFADALKKMGAKKDEDEYFVECDRKFEIKFRIGRRDYVISSKQLIGRPHKAGCELLINENKNRQILLGAPWFESYCTTFDWHTQHVTFAKPLARTRQPARRRCWMDKVKQKLICMRS